MICPRCGAQVPEGTKFCPKCGTSLKTICPNCGGEIPLGKRFCPYCGKDFYETPGPGKNKKKRSPAVMILAALLVGNEVKVLTRFFGDARDKALKINAYSDSAEQTDDTPLLYIMERDVYTVKENTSLLEVLRLFREKRSAVFPCSTTKMNSPDSSQTEISYVTWLQSSLSLSIPIPLKK